MNKLKLNLFDSILAGLAIGIAGLIYLSIYPWSNTLAALCFSIGLIIVILEDYHLYTGKIGYINKYSIPSYIICFLGNLIGVAIIAMFFLNHPMSLVLVENKLNYSPCEMLIRAIGCGFLMYVATHGKILPEKILRAIICVFGFIIAGFEHSIADLLYFLMAGRLFESYSLLLIGMAVLGNTIGAILGNYKDILKDLH